MDSLNPKQPGTKQKAGVAALVMCLVLGVASVVAAQAGPDADCSGDSVTVFGGELFGLEDGGNRLLSTSPSVRDFALASPLPAGTYSLNGVSYDGYETRELTNPQTQEQWVAEFVDSSGSVMATSAVTGDLADGILEATWSGSLGEVTLSAPATVVRVKHAAPGSVSVNSVRPVCIGATTVGETPTTTVETTTVPPAPTVPPSSVTVEFRSTASSASTVSIVCGDSTESATGTTVDLFIDDIAATTGCIVEYPADLDCALAVDPDSVKAASDAGVQNLVIPATGDTSVVVTIDCVKAQVANAVETAPTTTTTVAPAESPSTTAVSTVVDSAVETAKTATAQNAQPSFTG